MKLSRFVLAIFAALAVSTLGASAIHVAHAQSNEDWEYNQYTIEEENVDSRATFEGSISVGDNVIQNSESTVYNEGSDVPENPQTTDDAFTLANQAIITFVDTDAELVDDTVPNFYPSLAAAATAAKTSLSESIAILERYPPAGSAAEDLKVIILRLERQFGSLERGATSKNSTSVTNVRDGIYTTLTDYDYALEAHSLETGYRDATYQNRDDYVGAETTSTGFSWKDEAEAGTLYFAADALLLSSLAMICIIWTFKPVTKYTDTKRLKAIRIIIAVLVSIGAIQSLYMLDTFYYSWEMPATSEFVRNSIAPGIAVILYLVYERMTRKPKTTKTQGSVVKRVRAKRTAK